MDSTAYDIFRVIIVTAVSMLLLWIFKRQIRKVVTDLVVGSDTAEYQDVTVTDLRDRIESRMDEVLR